jgi:two-component system, sporulation sensor kinase C
MKRGIPMTPFEVSIIFTASATLTMLFVYAYLYFQYRERYIGKWAISWALYFLKLIFFDTNIAIGSQSALFILTYQLIAISTTMLLISGTYDFLDKKMKNWWIYCAITVTLLTYIITYYQWSALIKAVPTSLFQGAAYLWTGIIMIRKLNINKLGKYLTGASFILLGIHMIDYPFLRFEPKLVAFGYLTSAILRFVIPVGTLLIYFEKTRMDLINRESYYRLLTENAVDVIYRYKFSPTPHFEYISPAVEKTTGYQPEEYYDNPEFEYRVVHPEDETLLRTFRNEPNDRPLTMRIIRRDGVQLWTEQQGAPIVGDNGQIIAFEGIIRDITERKKWEQNMSRLDGLNAIGQMAANIAHEIRNPMTTVRGYLQLLGTKPKFAEYREEFALLLTELDRANSIITEYLSLSKQKAVDFKICQLNEIIEALYPLIQADANASSKYVELDLGNISEIRIDEKEIRQLILNFVRNGLEAMVPGGTLIIRTFRSGQETVLEIQDEGTGIPPHILEKLGTPFLTTKENGTGLGLAVCYRITSRHQADIHTRTGNTGTTFSVCFHQAKIVKNNYF